MEGIIAPAGFSPHPPLRGTFSPREKGVVKFPLYHWERVAEGRVRGRQPYSKAANSFYHLASDFWYAADFR
jgi:hypothetical protein